MLGSRPGTILIRRTSSLLSLIVNEQDFECCQLCVPPSLPTNSLMGITLVAVTSSSAVSITTLASLCRSSSTSVVTSSSGVMTSSTVVGESAHASASVELDSMTGSCWRMWLARSASRRSKPSKRVIDWREVLLRVRCSDSFATSCMMETEAEELVLAMSRRVRAWM